MRHPEWTDPLHIKGTTDRSIAKVSIFSPASEGRNPETTQEMRPAKSHSENAATNLALDTVAIIHYTNNILLETAMFLRELSRVLEGEPAPYLEINFR
jgi:hypothetical protein